MGRKGFNDYPNAETKHISHENYCSGDNCPDCGIGKLYNSKARKLLQFIGVSPIKVTRFAKEALRCNACSKEFVAKGNGVVEKWTASARSAIALHKVTGMPYYRFAKLQSNFGTPIAASTFWQQMMGLWEDCGRLIFEQLEQAVKESDIIYTDDTSARVLKVIYDNKRIIADNRLKKLAMEAKLVFEEGGGKAESSSRKSKDSDKKQKEEKTKSCYSTVVSTKTPGGNEVTLYYTKRSYCGQNIAELVSSGDKKIMSDASRMNIPEVSEEALKTIIMFKCLTHAGRKFGEIRQFYPEECNWFLQELKTVYDRDRETKEANMNDEARLEYHKRHSSEPINKIYKKIAELFNSKSVEPNSHLGRAMKYWVRHKQGLTEFLRSSGVELDNNRSERRLKEIIIQRRNSLFFKSLASAEITSGLSSIVSTCVNNGINPFEYLNWIQKHMVLLSKNPKAYLPWKYVECLNQTERIAA